MLTDSLNWNLGTRMTIRGKQPDKKKPIFTYSRIRHTVPTTTRILVAVGTSNSKQTWKYAGQCRIYINNSSPSSTTRFIGGIMVDEKPLALARLKLFDLSYLPPAEYAIEIIPPSWFESVSLESWWYDGEPVGLEKNIKDINSVIIPL